MNEREFLSVLKDSFKTYLEVGTSRSNAKLKNLHGSIAADIKDKLGNGFSVKSQGLGNGKEGTIIGRYYPKKVDITVFRGGQAVAGYAIKFVVRNYAQNSNNYFENMGGETSNIRANGIPYFQIFIIFDRVPYYKEGGVFKRYDVITQHNIDKYIALSNDDPTVYLHTPDKTLFVLLHLQEPPQNLVFADDDDYAAYYRRVIDRADLLTYSTAIENAFGDGVIYNDYVAFLEQTTRTISEAAE